MTPPADGPPRVVLHFSEDPSITVFEPHRAATAQVEGAWVWAVDTHREPTYWFPRDCPRVTYWPHRENDATEEQRAVMGWTAASRVHAIETGWLERMRSCSLFVYRFDAAPFRSTNDAFGEPGKRDGGFWVSADAVEPLSVEPVGDLLAKHVAANIELRVTPSLWELWDVVRASGLDFSGIRLRNAQPPRG